MHDFVSRLNVIGLFGYVDHDITFRVDEQITILTGVNGSGKTHVLNLLRDLVAFDLVALPKIPCSSARLEYASGKTLVFEHVEEFHFRLKGVARGRDFGELLYRTLPDPLEDLVPPFIQRVDDDLWIDRNDGELMTTAVVASRFGGRVRPRNAKQALEVIGDPDHALEEWSATFRSAATPTMVETKRLDTPLFAADHRTLRGRRAPLSRIRQYVEQVGEQIAAARRSSLEVSQRADRQFAARALDKARATVKESELRRNYEALAILNQELNLNGLTEASFGVEFPGGRTNPTERRILSVFLEDWLSKLSALTEVHDKLQTLRSVVTKKLVGKVMVVENGELQFSNATTGEQIRVEHLSSGEQHLIALFTMLIFSADIGTLLLIDEPEISLHAAWKHAFLSDIRNVAGLNDLQVVLATHSSGIVHGQWDLTEELRLPEYVEIVVLEDSSDE